MWGISTLTDSWPTQMTACTKTCSHIICHSAKQSNSKHTITLSHLSVFFSCLKVYTDHIFRAHTKIGGRQWYAFWKSRIESSCLLFTPNLNRSGIFFKQMINKWNDGNTKVNHSICSHIWSIVIIKTAALISHLTILQKFFQCIFYQSDIHWFPLIQLADS